jgi:hypothetical protein
MTFESPAAASSFPPGEKATVRTGFTKPIHMLAKSWKMRLLYPQENEVVVQSRC